MYKAFIAGLSLGLLALNPTTLNASVSVFEGIPTVQSSGDSLTSPLTELVSDSVAKAVDDLNLFRAQSTLSNMSKKEREKLANRLGSSRRIELERTIPDEHKDAAITKKSFCFMFWRSCFRISSKTLGSLAIDIVLDLSDGKLDGKGPNGSIHYIHHLAEIINATIEEVRAANSK